MAYSAKEINEIFNTICNRIEQGEALRTVLKDEDMPSSKTFYEWIDDDETKVKQYARATQFRADTIFDEMFEIADDGSNDYVTRMQQGKEVKVLDGEHVQRSRLRIDTRKWALSKLNPTKYGEKSSVELSGELKTTPNQHTYEEMYMLKYGKKPE